MQGSLDSLHVEVTDDQDCLAFIQDVDHDFGWDRDDDPFGQGLVDGARASLVVDRTLDLSAQPWKTISETGSVRIGRAEVFSYSVIATSGQPTQGTVHWGPWVIGARNATFQLTGGTTLTGNIDGRAFEPFAVGSDPATAAFADNGPSPKLHSLKFVQDALDRLGKAAKKALSQCVTPATLTSALVSVSSTDSDPGHFSDTYDTGSCNGAKALGCGVPGAIAATGCGIACAFTFGIGCVVCAAAAPTATATCIGVVETTGACCPVACGNGGFLNPKTCCFGNETCLNGDGLCCSQGKTACVGQNCCGSDESCIEDGVNKGTCCADSLFCGPVCCTAGQVCQNQGTGQCCAPSSECGSACCAPVTNGFTGGPQFCADAAASLCCDVGATECGGACCGGPNDPNKVCTNGQCVLGSTITCPSGENPCVDPMTGADLCDITEFCDGAGCCEVSPH